MPLFPPTTELSSLRVTAIDAAGVPVVVKNAPGSGMDLQQWQDSNGVLQAKIRFDGLVATSYVRNLSDNGPYLYLHSNYAQFVSVAPGNVPLVVSGAAGQTGNLQQWQDSLGVPSLLVRADKALQFYVAGDEANSGIIMARPAFAPNSLCLIGSGTTTGSRDVYIFDTLGVSASIRSDTGNITAASGIVTGAWGSFVNYINMTPDSVADKIYLYNGGGVNAYGFGIQANRLVAFVPAAAAFTVRSTLSTVPQSAGVDLFTVFGDGHVTLVNAAAAQVGLLVKGAVSQSANLQQWQSDTGTVLGRITSGGTLGINQIRERGLTGPFMDWAPTQVTLTSTTTSTNPLFVLRGASGQAGDLQQWQDDLGNAVAKMSPTGILSALHISKLGVSTTYLNLNANVAVLGQTAANVGLIVRGAASQSGDLQQWQDSGAVPLARVSKGGYFTTARTTAPADADVNASEVQQWWINTVGSTHVVFKGKDSSGSVVSYAPSRLLAVAKYTAVGPSAVRGAAASVGMVVSFTMPALQPGQRVRIEGTAYYYNFASSVAAHALYNFIYVNDTLQVAARFDWTSAVNSPSQRFEAVWGYIDNTEVAAGTWVNAAVWSLSTSGVAYQFVNPAHMAATIV